MKRLLNRPPCLYGKNSKKGNVLISNWIPRTLCSSKEVFYSPAFYSWIDHSFTAGKQIVVGYCHGTCRHCNPGTSLNDVVWAMHIVDQNRRCTGGTSRVVRVSVQFHFSLNFKNGILWDCCCIANLLAMERQSGPELLTDLCWPLHRRFHAALTAMPQSMEECVHR